MEAQSPFNLHPVQFQLSAMPTIQSLRYAFSGSSSEIIDVGEILRMMEDLNRDELQEFWSIMSHIHSCDVRDIQDYCYRLQHIISWESSGSQEVHRQKSNQMVAEKVLKTKTLVKSALVQVLRDFGVRINEQICDKELCFLVNKTVDEDRTQQFWNKVANLVPSKTKKQLYDFYHTSFSKALFDSQISIEDRKLIEQLILLFMTILLINYKYVHLVITFLFNCSSEVVIYISISCPYICKIQSMMNQFRSDTKCYLPKTLNYRHAVKLKGSFA
ncbi:Hypothetical_protein [Hexamita inflata]|uniref:Hypothetical_protein n=1 Tax=Hexamita inflata TaxID=28002 RepID=A0ABP1GK15_9EUKA